MQELRHALSLHHKLYPHLPNRLSCCHRLDGRTIPAEARQEHSYGAVAFGGDPRHRHCCCRLTDHPTRLVRVIRYWLHLWADRASGVVSITASSAFHFTRLDAWYYWVLAPGVLLTTSVLNTPAVSAAQRANLDTRTAM